MLHNKINECKIGGVYIAKKSNKTLLFIGQRLMSIFSNTEKVDGVDTKKIDTKRLSSILHMNQVTVIICAYIQAKFI
jgi:hypothetical protein